MQEQLTMEDLKDSVKSTFQNLPQLLWKVLAVNISFLLVSIPFLVLLFFAFLSTKSYGSFSDFLLSGSLRDFSIFFGIVLFVVLVYPLTWIIGQIATGLVMAHQIRQEHKNPFVLFFKDSWKYFWATIMLQLRSLWYIVWPTILIGLVLVMFSVGLGLFGIDLGRNPTNIILIIILSIAILASILILIYRGIKATMVLPLFFLQKLDWREAFTKGLKLMEQNWWRVFGLLIVFWGPFVILSGVIQMGYENAITFGPFEIMLILFDLITQIVIFPALGVLLYYLVEKRSTKTNVKRHVKKASTKKTAS